MFSKLKLTACLSAGFLAVLGACSSSSQLERESEAPSAAAAEEPVVQAADERTATEAATEGGEASSDAGAGVSSPILNPNAPRNYTVKRGDTLWDISSLFLRDPWLWPEIWYVNPQVPNPHLIYPGDVLALAYGADGRPQIRLERGGSARLNPRLRSSPLDGAIPTIPYADLAAFLSRPAVLAAEDVRKAPHVLALRDDHMIGGTGHEVYVRNLDAAQNSRFSVMHIGEELRDPDDGDVLGFEGIYTATALVTKPGDPAKALLSDSARETLEGDRLFATDTDVPLNFTPRAPASPVEGRIISVIDGVELIGQYQVVTINRGQRHGIEPGHVLAVDQAGEVVRDRHAGRMRRVNAGGAFAPRVRLPDERAGMLLVFKSFDRMSYALVVGASAPMRVLDYVRNP